MEKSLESNHNLIKIALALLLLACLFRMPYGYYQFVRFAALIGFALLAYTAHKTGRQMELLIFGLLALLFQPFFKVSLGRTLWNVMDVIVAVGLILSMIFRPTVRKA